MSRAQFMPFWTGKGAKMAAPTTVREREGAKGPTEVQTARQDAGTAPSFAAGQAGEAFQEGNCPQDQRSPMPILEGSRRKALIITVLVSFIFFHRQAVENPSV